MTITSTDQLHHETEHKCQQVMTLLTPTGIVSTRSTTGVVAGTQEYLPLEWRQVDPAPTATVATRAVRTSKAHQQIMKALQAHAVKTVVKDTEDPEAESSLCHHPNRTMLPVSTES